MTTFFVVFLFVVIAALFAVIFYREKWYAKNLALAMAPKSFGLDQLRAVSEQIALTSATVLAAMTAALVAGMKLCVAEDIQAERNVISRDIDNSRRRIASNKATIAILQQGIEREQNSIEFAAGADKGLVGIAALLPPPPAAEKK